MTRSHHLPALMLGVLFGAGCSPMTGDPADNALQRAGLRVAPSVLDQYVGTYRLASGARFPVLRDGDQLLGGTPPHELLAQTTRQFSSNRLQASFTLNDPDPMRRSRSVDFLASTITPANGSIRTSSAIPPAESLSATISSAC